MYSRLVDWAESLEIQSWVNHQLTVKQDRRQRESDRIQKANGQQQIPEVVLRWTSGRKGNSFKRYWKSSKTRQQVLVQKFGCDAWICNSWAHHGNDTGTDGAVHVGNCECDSWYDQSQQKLVKVPRVDGRIRQLSQSNSELGWLPRSCWVVQGSSHR